MGMRSLFATWLILSLAHSLVGQVGVRIERRVFVDGLDEQPRPAYLNQSMGLESATGKSMDPLLLEPVKNPPVEYGQLRVPLDEGFVSTQYSHPSLGSVLLVRNSNGGIHGGTTLWTAPKNLAAARAKERFVDEWVIGCFGPWAAALETKPNLSPLRIDDTECFGTTLRIQVGLAVATYEIFVVPLASGSLIISFDSHGARQPPSREVPRADQQFLSHLWHPSFTAPPPPDLHWRQGTTSGPIQFRVPFSIPSFPDTPPLTVRRAATDRLTVAGLRMEIPSGCTATGRSSTSTCDVVLTYTGTLQAIHVLIKPSASVWFPTWHAWLERCMRTFHGDDKSHFGAPQSISRVLRGKKMAGRRFAARVPAGTYLFEAFRFRVGSHRVHVSGTMVEGTGLGARVRNQMTQLIDSVEEVAK